MSRTMRRLVIVFALLGAVMNAAPAQTSQPHGVAVESAWARATPQGARTGAVYLTLVNHGSDADRLIALETPVADTAQLHTETNDNGIIKMRPLSALEVKPGASVVLHPGGTHVMLIGLKHPLKEGESFPLTLAFANSRKEEVQVTVAKAGAMGMSGSGGAAGHDMSGHDMSHMGR